MKLSGIFSAIALLVRLVTADTSPFSLEPECEGTSALCRTYWCPTNILHGTTACMPSMESGIAALNPQGTAAPGHHIFCFHGISDLLIGSGLCVFTEGTTENVSNADVKVAFQHILATGCPTCGHTSQGLEAYPGAVLKVDFVGDADLD